MTRLAVMIVTDASGRRGFIDVAHDWDPAQPSTRVLLADGGRLRVPTARLVHEADGTLRCPSDLAELAHGDPTADDPTICSPRAPRSGRDGAHDRPRAAPLRPLQAARERSSPASSSPASKE